MKVSQQGEPVIPGQFQDRLLTSVMAKYVNPHMFPRNRIVKFVRGMWNDTSVVRNLWSRSIQMAC